MPLSSAESSGWEEPYSGRNRYVKRYVPALVLSAL
jgi:hypothetical protein